MISFNYYVMQYLNIKIVLRNPYVTQARRCTAQWPHYNLRSLQKSFMHNMYALDNEPPRTRIHFLVRYNMNIIREFNAFTKVGTLNMQEIVFTNILLNSICDIFMIHRLTWFYLFTPSFRDYVCICLRAQKPGSAYEIQNERKCFGRGRWVFKVRWFVTCIILL